jgi:hypothetical protein
LITCPVCGGKFPPSDIQNHEGLRACMECMLTIAQRVPPQTALQPPEAAKVSSERQANQSPASVRGSGAALFAKAWWTVIGLAVVGLVVVAWLDSSDARQARQARDLEQAEQRQRDDAEKQRQIAADAAEQQRQKDDAEKQRQAAAQKEEAARLLAKQQEDQRQLQLTIIDRDPGAAFSRFSSAFLATLDHSESPEFFNNMMNRRQRNWFRVIPNTARIDVRRTDSVISPYIAVLDVDLYDFVNGERTGDDKEELKFTFAAQNHQWVLQSVTSFIPVLGSWEPEDHEAWMQGLWQTVMQNTTNP